MPTPPGPRAVVHPGPRSAVRLEHRQADRARRFRLSLPAGRSLHESLVEALASVGAASASMTLFGGDLEALSFCLPRPDPGGRVAATYGAPAAVRSARLVFGSATLGRSADDMPVVHCHAVFRTPDGAIRGGHLLPEKTIVGTDPVTAVATTFDGFDLRIGFDDETRMHLLRPVAENRHA